MRTFNEDQMYNIDPHEGIGDISPIFKLLIHGKIFSIRNRLFYGKFLINGCQ
jgi:hypothetical protein